MTLNIICLGSYIFSSFRAARIDLFLSPGLHRGLFI